MQAYKEKTEHQILEKIENLTKRIEEDPYSTVKASIYEQRSQQYQIINQHKSAIADLSKSLYIDPTCQGYVKRGKLFASSQMFYYAFMDFEEAQKIYQQEKIQYLGEDKKQIQNDSHKKNIEFVQERDTLKVNKNISPQTQTFLQKSTIILKLPQLKKISKQHERSKQFLPPELNQEFGRLMNKMIEQKITNELKSIKQQNKNYQDLLQLVKRQQQKIKQLEKNIENQGVDYERVFSKEIDESTLSNINKQKCSVYFCTVISEMQKFYLSAKVLSQFEEKISFEDYEEKYQQKIKEKKSNGGGFYAKVVEKVFKLFEKHEDKIERLGQIIKQMPYIGTAFKLIKPTLKICGAIQEIKLQSECENILSSRPSVSSFNRLSSRVAYQMYKYFKINITTETRQSKSQLYKKNYLEKLASQFHKFKRNQMAAKVFKYIKPEEKDYAEQMGSTHASILMVGIAYGVFYFPKDAEFEEGSWQKQTFEKVSEMEQKMLNTELEEIQQQNQIKVSQANQNGNGKACNIF